MANLLAAVLPFALLAVSGVAQQPGLGPTTPSVDHHAGLQAEPDGTLLGLGSDYKVHCHGDRWQMVPYLGMAAPHDLPLGLVTTHVGRGELEAVGPATRQRGDLHVDYVRPQCVERLEFRPEAMKHSYVFTHLPAGNGDLVVRTAITTELQAERSPTADELRWSLPGTGGITISQVVGIDANGRRATGSMRCADGNLDFVLPADFVATAKLPLVLDPFLTTTLALSSTAIDERDPQIARLGTVAGSGGHRSCVVWRRTISATNHDFNAIRYGDNGVAFGGLVAIESTTADASHARIGAQHSGQMFLVAWEQDGNLMGRRIENSLVSPAMVLRDTADTLTTPDVVGGPNNSPLLPLTVVWLNQTQNRIEHDDTSLGIATQSLGMTILVTGSATNLLSNLAVSRDLPNNEFAMLTWVQENTAHGTFALRAATFQRGFSLVGPQFTVAAGSNADFHQNVAGDGALWLIAYEHDSASSQNLSVRPVRTDKHIAVELGPPRSLSSGAIVSGQPDVAFLADSAIVAWTRANGPDFDVVLTSVDPVTAQDCEGQILVDLGGNGTEVAVCGCATAPPVTSRDECQLAWTALNGSLGTIAARRYGAIDGAQAVPQLFACHPNVDMRLYGTAARVGNAGFGFQLHRATPGELTFALVSLTVSGGFFPCGPCTVVPDSVNGVISFTGAADSVGGARFPLPIPNDPNLANLIVKSQFVMLGSNCLANFNLSPAVIATIEL